MRGEKGKGVMSLIKAGTFSIFSEKTSLLIISDFKPEFHT